MIIVIIFVVITIDIIIIIIVIIVIIVIYKFAVTISRSWFTTPHVYFQSIFIESSGTIGTFDTVGLETIKSHLIESRFVHLIAVVILAGI
jgi:hypothetical protein